MKIKPIPDDDWIWWKHGVVYQIYPRSFYDFNNDGIGDIPGIIEKLDYIQGLGIDAIWLSPINTSPMYDFGYDISDYYNIDHVFGQKSDFKLLIKEAHERNIKIIMDLVLNHTSHLHQWFLSSRSSRNNPKRAWYIWRDGKNAKSPNNWYSMFGGSAWTWDQLTCQYYLHSFLKEQPDVNWRSPELKEAMFKIVKYWLDKGVDGFRLDVVNWFVKDKYFRNNPAFLGYIYFQKHKYDRNQPEVHTLLKEFRKILDEYDNRMSVGEVFSIPPGDPELSASFLGNGEDELHLAFDFSIMFRWWNARQFYKVIRRWLHCIPEKGWPCHVLSNHDQPRSISRYGDGKNDIIRAKVAATLLLTLYGTPFIYYGEEIGMKNNSIPKKDIKDPFGKRFWPFYSGRDPMRTPMQWSSGKNAGFTKGKEWLPVSSDYKIINVKSQEQDPYSLLNYYKHLIALRKLKKALYKGSWHPALRGRKGVIAYYRIWEGEKIFVAMNFTNKDKKVHVHDRAQWKVLASTHKFINMHLIDLSFMLSPYEAVVFEQIGKL